jgi:hypothetical protein
MQAAYDPQGGLAARRAGVFDPADALGGAPGAPVGWLLDEPSPRARLADAR